MLPYSSSAENNIKILFNPSVKGMFLLTSSFSSFALPVLKIKGLFEATTILHDEVHT